MSEYWRTAWIAPIRMPRKNAKPSAQAESRSVLGRKANRTSRTGRECEYENPKSPVSIEPTHVT
jgi:hypothetical protein